MKLQLILLSILSMLRQTVSKFAFYNGALFEPSTYKCLKPSIDSRMILIFYYGQESFSSMNLLNIQNAVEAGLTVELVLLPYRCRSVDEDILFVRRILDIDMVSKFWVALETVYECPWSDFSPEDNCKYLMELISKWGQLNKKVQISTWQNDWINAFKDLQACPEPSTKSLLWDINPNEKGYRQIGGWKSPYMTFLAPTQLCGKTILASLINSQETVLAKEA